MRMIIVDVEEYIDDDTMTVREFIGKLQGYNPDDKIFATWEGVIAAFKVDNFYEEEN